MTATEILVNYTVSEIMVTMVAIKIEIKYFIESHYVSNYC